MTNLRKWLLAAGICAIVVVVTATLIEVRISLSPVAKTGSKAVWLSENVVFPVASTRTVSKTAAIARSKIDWEKEYKQSGNYFDFVSRAARQAFDGDGRAALFISKALYQCSPVAKQYAHSVDPEADFNAYWAGMTKAPQWVLDKARKDFQACFGFIRGDAFAGLPDRPGGYNSIRYWADQASADNDPVAQSIQAGTDVAKTVFEKSSSANATSIESAQLSINNAVASGDPAALFKVGQILTDGHASNNPLQGFAVSIAACNMGYDCSADNVEIFGDCAAQGQCTAGSTYADLVKKAIGEDGYAKAYAVAQQIEDAVARGDSTAVQQLVKLSPVK
jgi:hypothetical protein